MHLYSHIHRIRDLIFILVDKHHFVDHFAVKWQPFECLWYCIWLSYLMLTWCNIQNYLPFSTWRTQFHIGAFLFRFYFKFLIHIKFVGCHKCVQDYFASTTKCIPWFSVHTCTGILTSTHKFDSLLKSFACILLLRVLFEC